MKMILEVGIKENNKVYKYIKVSECLLVMHFTLCEHECCIFCGDAYHIYLKVHGWKDVELMKGLHL